MRYQHLQCCFLAALLGARGRRWLVSLLWFPVPYDPVAGPVQGSGCCPGHTHTWVRALSTMFFFSSQCAVNTVLLQVDIDSVCRPFNRGCLYIVSTISWHLDIDIVCRPFNRGCLYIVSTIWILTLFAGLSTGAVYILLVPFGHWQCLLAFQQGLFIYCQYHLAIDSVCWPFNRGCLYIVSTIWPLTVFVGLSTGAVYILSVPFGHWQCLPAFQQGLFIYCQYHLAIDIVCWPFNRGCLYIVSTIWTLTVFASLSTGAVYILSVPFGHWHCLLAFQQGLFIYCQYHLDVDSVCQPFNRGCLYIVSTIWPLTVFVGLSTGAVYILSVPFGHWQCLPAFQQGLFIYCQYHLAIDIVCWPFNRGCLYIVSTIWPLTVFVGLSTRAVYWQCLSAFQQAFYCQYHLEWNQHRAADNQSSKHFTQLDCHDWCSTWKTQTDKGMEKRYNYNYNNLLFYVLFLQIRSCSPSQSEEQNTAWACSHTRTDACMHKHI